MTSSLVSSLSSHQEPLYREKKLDFYFKNLIPDCHCENMQELHTTPAKDSACGIPVAHISLLQAGNMQKSNRAVRNNFFLRQGIEPNLVLSAVQIHSKKILFFDDEKTFPAETEADGIITCNPNLLPAVLVADCMPIFLFDTKSRAFGVLHSGWRGTGIALEALKLLKQKFNTSAADVFFIFGPHIRNCCYTVDAERARFFRRLAKSSVNLSVQKLLCLSRWRYRLSLANANRSLLETAAVPPENILDTELCTNCNTIAQLCSRGFLPETYAGNTDFSFGSNRRENPHGQTSFTRMIAYIQSGA